MCRSRASVSSMMYIAYDLVLRAWVLPPLKFILVPVASVRNVDDAHNPQPIMVLDAVFFETCTGLVLEGRRGVGSWYPIGRYRNRNFPK